MIGRIRVYRVPPLGTEINLQIGGGVFEVMSSYSISHDVFHPYFLDFGKKCRIRNKHTAYVYIDNAMLIYNVYNYLLKYIIEH